MHKKLLRTETRQVVFVFILLKERKKIFRTEARYKGKFIFMFVYFNVC